MKVVIKKGKHLNRTLATVLYDGWGQNTLEQVIICDTWEQGWQQASGLTLFVDSGTVFTDWNQWKELIGRYPHQGLVAHLIWHPQQRLRLDEQCWLLDTDQFELADLQAQHVRHPVPVRSDKNIHDDYTPLYVRPGQQWIEYDADGFGQGLVAKQLSKGKDIVNWNQRARSIKYFCYNDDLSMFDKYTELAEHQLWVLNNQPIKLATSARLITPGSGMFWMLNCVQPTLKNLHVIDISHTQIDFCKQLWQSWTGENYGLFAWNYIQHNQLKHFEIDLADIDHEFRNKLNDQNYFVTHVNQQFDQVLKQHNIENFQRAWSQRTSCEAQFLRDNLIDWVLNNHKGLDPDSAIWCSNITEYRWTLLNNSQQKISEFCSALVDSGIQIL